MLVTVQRLCSSLFPFYYTLFSIHFSFYSLSVCFRGYVTWPVGVSNNSCNKRSTEYNGRVVNASFHVQDVSPSVCRVDIPRVSWFSSVPQGLCQNIIVNYATSFIIWAWGNVVVNALLVGRSPDRSPVVSLGIFSEASDKSMCPGSTRPFEMSIPGYSWG
jgi:hypothetical protein